MTIAPTARLRVFSKEGWLAGEDKGSGGRKQRRFPGQFHYGHIVVLPEPARSFGDVFCRLARDCRGVLKSEQFSLGVACFGHAVGDEHELITGLEAEVGFGVIGFWIEAEGKTVVQREFAACDVWCEMARVGSRDISVWVEAEDDAGSESSTGARQHALVHCTENLSGFT